MTATEGTALWLRARWHEEQAEQLLQKNSYGKALVAHILDPWRLPFEKSFVAPHIEPLPELSDNWFFFGFYLHTPDINFVGSLKQPYKALETWKNKSILANYLQSCVKEKKLDPECVIDQASLLENRIREINKNKTKDREEEVNSELLYEVFPVFARYSLLRVGALWAQENDQHRDSGRLRLIVREASGPIRDPLFLLAFAAWEAGNKSTLRAQDIVHEFSSEFSSLQSARIPLDSLHIRRGRDSVQDGPSH